MAPNVMEMLPHIFNKTPAIPNILEKCPSLSEMKKHLPTITTLKELANAIPTVWTKCPNTNKPEVCEENLWKLRAIVGGTTVAGGVAGYYLLPAIGFSAIGPDPGSTAAAWQSSIGIVKSGSLFSICQSVGMSGTGVVLLGGTAASLTLLAGAVTAKKLDWCTCQYDMRKDKSKL